MKGGESGWEMGERRWEVGGEMRDDRGIGREEKAGCSGASTVQCNERLGVRQAKGRVQRLQGTRVLFVFLLFRSYGLFMPKGGVYQKT
jgi:hypothetical protein